MKRIGIGRFLFASTGRQLFPKDNVIGITPEGDVFGGFLHFLDDVVHPRDDGHLTKAEKVELADYMIKLWTDYKAGANTYGDD